jgi:hypothetical protein
MTRSIDSPSHPRTRSASAQSLEPGLDDDVTPTHRGYQIGGDDGDPLDRALSRNRPRWRQGSELSGDGFAKDEVHQPPRHPVQRIDIRRVVGSAADPAKDHVGAAAHGHQRSCSHPRDLDGDLGSRLTGTHHENAASRERLGRPVVVRVADLPGEVARSVGELRVPEQADRHDHRLVATNRAIIECDSPLATRIGLEPFNGHSEVDEVA